MKLTTRIIISSAALLLVAGVAVSCNKEQESKQYFTVTFDANGGEPTPEPQKVLSGGYAVEPDDPVKENCILDGWYTQLGTRFNFGNNKVTKDFNLTARWIEMEHPQKFVFIQSGDTENLFKKISEKFGPSTYDKVGVGCCVQYCLLERNMSQFISELKNHLYGAKTYEIPILIEFEPYLFGDGVPELLNWWDTSKGKDSNRDNVEWTSWSNQDAVKCGWLNWGSQCRIPPMPNLFSKEYQTVLEDRVDQMMKVICAWYEDLPADKKYLLVGIKVTGELAIGVNNWYYPNGNYYLETYGSDTSHDPTYGINMYTKPSRGVQTIGFASLKSAGIKSSGQITGDDIATLEYRYAKYMSELIAKYGFPREMLFAHAGGVGNDLKSCINSTACPGWSFYGNDATNPAGFTDAMQYLAKSDAPYFGVCEWALDSKKAQDWYNAITNCFAIDRCRFVSAFCDVLGNQAAIDGIKKVRELAE